LQQEHVDKVKKMKEKQLHNQIQEKIKYNPKELDKGIERKTRQLRLEQQQRDEDYEKKMDDMRRSVEFRKLQIDKFEEVILKFIKLAKNI